MDKSKEISLKCPKCGGIEFNFPEDIQDDDFLSCQSCWLEIMYCDMKEANQKYIESEAMKLAEQEVKKALKGILK